MHECAHGKLHTEAKFRDVPNYVKEYEAEIWTLRRFEQEGVEYPNMHSLSSEYLMGQIQDDYNSIVCYGIDRRALKYLTTNDQEDLEKVFNQWAACIGLTFRRLDSYRGPSTPENRLR